MYNFVQNYFQKNVHFYIDINILSCSLSILLLFLLNSSLSFAYFFTNAINTGAFMCFSISCFNPFCNTFLLFLFLSLSSPILYYFNFKSNIYILINIMVFLQFSYFFSLFLSLLYFLSPSHFVII